MNDYPYPTYFSEIIVFKEKNEILRGIIYREKRRIFLIITKQNIFKKILKKNHLFKIDNRIFINGNLLINFNYLDRLKRYIRNERKKKSLF